MHAFPYGPRSLRRLSLADKGATRALPCLRQAVCHSSHKSWSSIVEAAEVAPSEIGRFRCHLPIVHAHEAPVLEEAVPVLVGLVADIAAPSGACSCRA